MTADARHWLRLPRRGNVGMVKFCQSAKTCKIGVGDRAVVLPPRIGIRYSAELTRQPGHGDLLGGVGEQPRRRRPGTST
jgi:hypothetical protein